MSFFETKARISLDPIVGLMQTASKDNDPDKLLAIVGSAMDDQGKLIIPDTVRQTSLEVAGEALNMAYTPSSGLKSLASAIKKEVLSEDILKDLETLGVRSAEVVTNGGTHAISSSIMACTFQCDAIVMPTPHWAGYDSICQALNRINKVEFDLLDNDHEFNIKSFAKAIHDAVRGLPAKRKAKITVVLNTPFDNPLGKNFGAQVWEEIASVFNSYPKQEFLLILDTAYVDFDKNGRNPQALSFLAKLFEQVTQENFSVIIAATLSKSFAMYAARVGAAILLSREFDNVSHFTDRVGGIIRGTVSNLNRQGQETALRILSDEQKLNNIYEYQADTIKLINERTEYFINECFSQMPDEFEVIRPDGGFFVSMRLTSKCKKNAPDFALRLAKILIENHIYVPVIAGEYVRIPVCGLSKETLALLTSKLVEHSKNLLVSA
jgi:aspartate/tyrosine/aromatic aminotransferase